MSEITIDATQFSYVLTCDECAVWRPIRSTRAGAWRAAADHLRHTHAELAAAQSAVRAARNCEHRQAGPDRRRGRRHRARTTRG
ncbi:hypothetical protein SEA_SALLYSPECIAL_3 [Gordonia phage SallySpecial]|uniref:Uncharacterized protein n=1 Tax=Gordonia phage SallySpecial TaxID=2079570 RepID=A0A2P1CBZ3_9CAUD|nr:hypothetical protein PQC62_gp03 [Gordonia phage SallySpecial]AVJ48751.1 hypothetical protein SEA_SALLYSPECIAL_3 [Gordonia phage SallySpecial]